jgi:phasin
MESVMIASLTPQFEIPTEMRALAERSVEQAKLAFNNYMRAVEKAVSTFGERVEASQAGTLDVSKQAMHFAEHNVLSAFEFAHEVIRTKDVQNLVRMPTEFLQSQMQALNEQVTDLSETLGKVVIGKQVNPENPVHSS